MHAYQIAIFANGHDADAAILRSLLEERLLELGVDISAVVFLDEKTIQTRDKIAGLVAAYFGGVSPPVASPDLLDLLQESILVLPLVPSTTNYKSFVPSALSGINGFVWDGSQSSKEAAASVLLEGLALLRKSRRLFISYLRKETSNIAIRLFEFFERHGFDVFLDTHSVRPGEPFQDVLWHRMADTDVVVALDSPEFPTSYWTSEEISRASLTNIQVLQVLWPGRLLSSLHALNYPYELSTTNFVNPSLVVGEFAQFSEATENELLRLVESLRARALSSRHTYLVQEFSTDARAEGYFPKMQPERFITVVKKDGNLLAAVPTVGVPDAVRYHEIEDLLEKHSVKHHEIVLLFDDRGILKRWKSHLGWLNQQKLKVRSVSVNEVANFLKAIP
jgi:hypothetical protein